jgi:glucokinase
VAHYLGIEIGGTKLQLGFGPGDGTLAGLWRGAVDVAAGAEGIRRQITAAVPELLARAGVDRAQVAGAGVGFGGPVEDARQRVIRSHQIAGWDDFPLADWLTDLLGWPVALGNDADVAGLAEALFGAGKGLSPVFYITIGSGIGGGLIIDGDIYRGCGCGAAEIGHLRIATESGSGLVYRPLEEVASGWGIQARALTDARLVGQAAEQGEASAREVLESAWTCLAEAICHVIALLCPRRIVIGGGVSLMGERVLFGPLRRLVAERVFRPFAACCDIVPAALGEEVVVHGALALACRRFGPGSGGCGQVS